MLGEGHIKAQCRSEIDRSGDCYRCGRSGHLAIGCTNEVACAICYASGIAIELGVRRTVKILMEVRIEKVGIGQERNPKKWR